LSHQTYNLHVFLEIAALKNNSQAVDLSLNVSSNIKARLAHLAADSNSIDILHKIYATDTSVRTLDMWKVLANDFINNPAWMPRRVIDDRLYDVDPTHPPEEKLSPEALRSVFSRLRIEYTKALLKFQSAPKTSITQESLDAEFWERYAKHDKGLYYIYLLFKGRSDQDCLMVDAALSRTDHELDQVLSAYGAPQAQTPTVGMKRDLAAMTSNMGIASTNEEEMLMMVDNEHMHLGLAHPMGSLSRPREDFMVEEAAWQATVRKDRAITNYYKRLSINHDVRFYLDLLGKESTGEAMKRNLRNKINALLLKKVEDRYDDLL
jgi:hypothetical protein